MAYAFDKIMGQMGKGSAPDDQKADIFGNTSTSSAGSGGFNAQAARSAEGDLTGASGTNTGESTAAPKSNDVSSNAALASNVGKAQSPVDLKKLRSGVAGRGTQLQQEADSYVNADYRKGPSALSDDDKLALGSLTDPLKKGSYTGGAGDETGFVPGAKGHAKDDIGYWTDKVSNAPTISDHFHSSVDTEDPNVEALGTDAGVQQLLRRSSGPEYNAGDAAFDQALLNRDNTFQTDREGLLRDYGALQDKKSHIGDETDRAAKLAQDGAYGSYLNDLRGYLNGQGDVLQGRAKARETEYEDATQKAIQAKLADRGSYVNAERDALAGDTANGQYKDYLGDAASGVDPSTYVKSTFDPTALGWDSYVNGDEAGAFNNIMTLLGKGANYSAGKYANGINADDFMKVDKAGLDSDIMGKAQNGYKVGEDAKAAQAAKDAERQKQLNADVQAQIEASMKASTPQAHLTINPQKEGPLDPANEKLRQAGVSPGVANTLAPGSNTDMAPAPLRRGGLLDTTGLRKKLGI